MKVFDNYEISPCCRLNDDGEPDPNGKTFEVCEPHEADVWTLYGHIPGEGVMAIGDFATREGAEEAFQRITGILFTGSYQAQDRLRVMHAGATLLAALEKAHSRLLWARDLAGRAADLISQDDASGVQELLDEIATSEYANDDLDAITSALAEATDGTPSHLHPIVIEVRGGVVVDVQNVPPGYRYEVKDHDNLEADDVAAGRVA